MQEPKEGIFVPKRALTRTPPQRTVDRVAKRIKGEGNESGVGAAMIEILGDDGDNLDENKDTQSQSEDESDVHSEVEEERDLSEGFLASMKAIKDATNNTGESGKLQFNKGNQIAVWRACDRIYREFIELIMTIRRLERNLGSERARRTELVLEQKILKLENKERIQLLEKELDRESKRRKVMEKSFEEELNERVGEIRDEILQKNERKKEVGIATYAQVIQEGRTGQKKDNTILVVKSKKEGGEQHTEVRKKLVERLQMEEIGGGVRTIRPTKKGDLLINTQNKEQKDKIKEAISRMDSLEAGEPKDRGPTVKFTGVDKGYSGTELKEIVWNQNKVVREKMEKEEYDKSINFVTARTCRNESRENWTATVGGKLFKIFMEDCQSRVHIDLVSIYVEEEVQIVKCYKCCGYGHISKHCKDKECCPQCGGEHRKTECLAETMDCPNCKRLNLEPREHSADDHNCPAHQRRMVLVKRNINYE